MPASENAYSVEDLVRDLRAIVAATGDDREIVRRVMPLARRIGGGPDLRRKEFYDCDPEQGFAINILHEEPDHTLLVEAIAWLPGRGVKPHNHKTWGVVVGLDGRETNVNWRRRDDGSQPGFADLVAHHEVSVGPGDVVAFLPDDIHSVRNDDSIVLELRYRDVSVILPGDISDDVERSLVPRIPPAPRRILKLAHHGSATSTSAGPSTTVSVPSPIATDRTHSPRSVSNARTGFIGPMPNPPW